MLARSFAALARRLVPFALLLSVSGAAAEAPVSFKTGGGDAWTMHKTVEGRVPVGRCDQIAVSSPAGAVRVAPHDGRFVAQVPLTAGDNPVEAQCLKDGAAQGSTVQQTWHLRLSDTPKARVRSTMTDGGIILDGSVSEPASARAAAIVRYEWHARPGNPTAIAALPAEGPVLALSQAWTNGEHFVTLKVTDAAGRSDESTAVFRVTNGKAQVVDITRYHPAWIDNAVVYGVVPALFGRNGLRDVTAQLDRLAALGINTLWVVPVTQVPPGDFGYAVTDYFRLRPDFGSEDDLRALVQAAHARNMRVIIDFVPNHVSDQHAYFADTLKKAGGSAYFDYFNRATNGDATNYFDWRNLKNLNFNHPEVRNMLIEAFSYWVRTFDVDGFRVDVAWGPRERAPDFWPSWRTELRRIKPDLLLLAEASARDPYYLENGFDGAYDWTDKLGEWAWQGAFDDDAKTAPRLRAALAATPPNARVFRFINNNDTGKRFITRHGLARTKVAAAMLLTVSGLPSLFTGQEVGAEYEPYKTSAPLSWSDPHGLQSWYARLIAIRQDNPELRASTLRLLDSGDNAQVLTYVRACSSGSGRVVVALNFGAKPARVVLPPELLDQGHTAVDLLHEINLPVRSELEVAPHDARVLSLQKGESGKARCSD